MAARKNISYVFVREDYSSLLLWVTLVTLLVIIGFGYYWLSDQRRLNKVSQDHNSALVAHGKSLFASQCAACHGANGEGGVGFILNDQTLLKNTPEGVFYSIIRSGVPQTKMPAWAIEYGGPLTDEDIHALSAYIQAWKK